MLTVNGTVESSSDGWKSVRRGKSSVSHVILHIHVHVHVHVHAGVTAATLAHTCSY